MIRFNVSTIRVFWWSCCLGVWSGAIPVGAADGVRGFIEPYQNIQISAGEMGVLSDVRVVEGQHVRAGQTLGQLDDRVLQSTLKIAETAGQSRGALRAAEVEQRIKRQQLDGYIALVEEGNATAREVERAQADFDQAVARVIAAEEQIRVRELEYERTLEQIRQRKIVSTIDGVVVEIMKRPGEFVSPTDPVVMRVAQLDRLKCSLTVPYDRIEGIVAGREIRLVVGGGIGVVPSTVDFVSPVIDPQSGTVVVKVQIPNSDGKLKAGLVCRMEWDTTPRTARLLP